MGNTVSICASKKGASILLLLALFCPLRSISLQNAKIHRIFMVFDGRQNPADWNTYSPLIPIHTGDDYNGQRIKASLENLFKTDDFQHRSKNRTGDRGND